MDKENILFKGKIDWASVVGCGDEEDIQEMKESFGMGDWIEGYPNYYGDVPYILGRLIVVNQEYVAIEFWMPVLPETLGMYIGMNDKYNRKLFEHDVVKYDTYLEPMDEILMIDGCWSLSALDSDGNIIPFNDISTDGLEFVKEKFYFDNYEGGGGI